MNGHADVMQFACIQTQQYCAESSIDDSVEVGNGDPRELPGLIVKTSFAFFPMFMS